MQLLDLVLHLLAKLLVERAERLVHQHELGLEHERARERDALLLAARELAGRRSARSASSTIVERALDALLLLRPWARVRTYSGKAMFSPTVMCGKRA